MPSHARVNQRNRGHQSGPVVTVQRSIHTKSLHGIVQSLCILVGIKVWVILHRPPVDLGKGGERVNWDGAVPSEMREGEIEVEED